MLNKSPNLSLGKIRAFSVVVFSALFMQCCKIDMCKTKMHRWKFKALFDGLSEDTELHKVMGYRAIEIDKSMSAERAKQYNEQIYKLPKYLFEEQKNAELKRILHENYK